MAVTRRPGCSILFPLRSRLRLTANTKRLRIDLTALTWTRPWWQEATPGRRLRPRCLVPARTTWEARSNSNFPAIHPALVSVPTRHAFPAKLSESRRDAVGSNIFYRFFTKRLVSYGLAVDLYEFVPKSTLARIDTHPCEIDACDAKLFSLSACAPCSERPVSLNQQQRLRHRS